MPGSLASVVTGAQLPPRLPGIQLPAAAGPAWLQAPHRNPMYHAVETGRDLAAAALSLWRGTRYRTAMV